MNYLSAYVFVLKLYLNFEIIDNLKFKVLEINEIVNNGKHYLILSIGKDVRFQNGNFEINLALTEINADSLFSDNIISINYFKIITKKTIKVWAPYQYLGLYKQFDIIVNGRKTNSLSSKTSVGEIEFYKKHTQYSEGNNIPELNNLSGEFWDIIKNQNFAIIKIPYNNNLFIVPCSEIYRSVFGKYESAILDVTFRSNYQINDENNYNYFSQILNLEKTIAGNILFDPVRYIHLRKQFTPASALFAYRIYKHNHFRLSFRNVTNHIITNKNLIVNFPVIKYNKVHFNYVTISKGIYYATSLNGVHIEEEEENLRLKCDTDNRKGEKTNENTKVVKGTKIVGVKPNIQETILPIQHGPVDPIIPPINIENSAPERDPFTANILITEVKKEFKKTITEESKKVKRDPKFQGFFNGNGTSPGTVQNTYKLVENSMTFDVLDAIMKLLQEQNIFKVSYYLNKPSHPLSNKAKEKSWESIPIVNSKDYFSRNIGVIHIYYNEMNFYLIEIQEKKKETLSLGIIYLKDFKSIITDIHFKSLKEKIIEKKGNFKQIASSGLKELFSIKHIKHSVKRNIDKKDSKKYNSELINTMTKNITSKVKKISGV